VDAAGVVGLLDPHHHAIAYRFAKGDQRAREVLYRADHDFSSGYAGRCLCQRGCRDDGECGRQYREVSTLQVHGFVS
jgi:hypothetical protein